MPGEPANERGMERKGGGQKQTMISVALNAAVAVASEGKGSIASVRAH